METSNNVKYTFKLGNNFTELITDKVREELNHFEYNNALTLLKTVGLNDDIAIGVLFSSTYSIAENPLL